MLTSWRLVVERTTTLASADHDGGYDWIVPVPSPRLDTKHRLPFDDFLRAVDAVVMSGELCSGVRLRDQDPMAATASISTS